MLRKISILSILGVNNFNNICKESYKKIRWENIFNQREYNLPR